MAKRPDYEKIVAAAGSRANVNFSKDDLVKLRGYQPESTVGQWIEKNLTTDTLLSREELRISEAAICNRIIFDRSAAGSNSTYVPLREDELLAAITDLEASTETLNRQSSVLEAQQALIERHYDAQTETQRSSHLFVDEIERRNTASIQRLRGDILEVQDEIEGLFQSARDAIDRSSRRIPSVISELMNSNDRTLADLADLAKEHSIGASTKLGTSTDIDTVNRLTALLSKMIAEELQIRLDRTYLENLQRGAEHQVNGDQHMATEDAQVLEEDLYSLFTEIPDVAEMFVAQKYGEPLLQAIHVEEQQRAAMVSLHARGVTGQLSRLTADLDELARRLRGFHSYRCLIHNLRASYNHFDTSSIISSSSTEANPQLPQHNGPALEALLRHFGVSTASSGDLHQSINGKIARLREGGRGSVQDINSGAKTTLEARYQVLESLVRSIDQSDEDSLVRLEAIEARIKSLRDEVEAVSGRDKDYESRKQRAFTEKWC